MGGAGLLLARPQLVKATAQWRRWAATPRRVCANCRGWEPTCGSGGDRLRAARGVVDANVEQVVAGLFAIDEPLPSRAKPFDRSGAITPDERAGDFAQAMMDLGSSLHPRDPKCLLCPLSVDCEGRKQGEPARYPVKAPKKPKPVRKGTAFWIERDGHVWLVRREGKGMLGGMRALPDNDWSARGDGSGDAPLSGAWEEAGSVSHAFTHFSLELSVKRLKTAAQPNGG